MTALSPLMPQVRAGLVPLIADIKTKGKAPGEALG